MSEPHSHKPGSLKKANKPFKSRHASKGSLKKANKGKVEAVVRTNIKTSTAIQASKADRANQARQLQRNKREELMRQKRLGHANEGPPKLIAVIALSAKVDPKQTVKMMLEDIGVSEEQQQYHETNEPFTPITVSVPKFKSRLSFYPTTRKLTALLDICKVADTVLFVMDSEEVIDSYGAALLSALMAQGLPTVMGAIVGLDSVAAKHRSEARKHAVKTFQQRFTDEPRIVAVESSADVSNLVRFLCVGHIRSFWRNQRSYMLPSKIDYTPNTGVDGELAEFGTLHLTGHIRGDNFDVNNLVHLTGIGDFQVLFVDSAIDPQPYDKRGPSAFDQALRIASRQEKEIKTIATPNPEYQETLISENEVDDMNNEQTWPTEDDAKHASSLIHKKKIRVPKGMSLYQAMWLQAPSDEEEDMEDDDEDEEDGMEQDDHEMDQDEEEEEFEEEEEVEYEEVDDEETALIKKLEAQAEELKKNDPTIEEKANKKKYQGSNKNPDLMFDDEEIEEDFDYPDEVEIPDGQLAQDAFRDYRGLRSFRTSPWNPKENLPRDYGKIFRFPHFEATRKRVMKVSKLAEDAIPVGTYVTIHLKDVHASVLQQIDPSAPLVASSLLMFENKFSVMHYAVTKSVHYEPYVRTGEDLLFHVGFRRFSGNAIFTEDTRGSTKYKMEKVLHPGRGCIASVFAPVTFPHQPVLVWQLDENGVPCLAASGTVRTCDPDRIIVKKIVLTGHPMSVEKGKVVVRGMFHHPADVRYYQKAELSTKSGVRGQIKEPLGTKGLFKCIFGDRISNADTVCLNLYKRVYPNWLEVPQPPRVPGTITVAPVPPPGSNMDDESEEIMDHEMQ